MRSDKEEQRKHVREEESGTVKIGKVFMIGSLTAFLAVNILKNNRIYFTGVSYWFVFGFAAAVFAMGAIKLYQARKIEQYMDMEIDSGRVILVEKKRYDEMLRELNKLRGGIEK